MINVDPASDYRVQELLTALNEGLLEAEFVRRRLAECMGGKAELVHYSDGTYDVIE
jgi:hypothetical protein